MASSRGLRVGDRIKLKHPIFREAHAVVVRLVSWGGFPRFHARLWWPQSRAHLVIGPLRASDLTWEVS